MSIDDWIWKKGGILFKVKILSNLIEKNYPIKQNKKKANKINGEYCLSISTIYN